MPLRKAHEEDDDQEGRTPPALYMTVGYGHMVLDWFVTYYFFLGPLTEHFTFHLGRVMELDEAAAQERAFVKQSPQLDQARLAFLRAVTLETMH